MSTEITGTPCFRHFFTAALICRNCLSRSGWSAPSSAFRFALQAIVRIVKYLRHLRVTDQMFLPGELRCNCPRALTNPSQGRFRITACLAIYQCFQRLQQPRIRFQDGLAPCTRTTNATCRRHYPFLISLIPLAMALRDKPHARCTSEIPTKAQT